MTRKQARKKTRKLINDAAEMMRKKLERVLYSGAINFDNYEDDYELPKIIVHALLKESMNQYEPLLSKNRKASQNLYICI